MKQTTKTKQKGYFFLSIISCLQKRRNLFKMGSMGVNYSVTFESYSDAHPDNRVIASNLHPMKENEMTKPRGITFCNITITALKL